MVAPLVRLSERNYPCSSRRRPGRTSRSAPHMLGTHRTDSRQLRYRCIQCSREALMGSTRVEIGSRLLKCGKMRMLDHGLRWKSDETSHRWDNRAREAIRVPMRMRRGVDVEGPSRVSFGGKRRDQQRVGRPLLPSRVRPIATCFVSRVETCFAHAAPCPRSGAGTPPAVVASLGRVSTACCYSAVPQPRLLIQESST